jgi:hypothetical protein
MLPSGNDAAHALAEFFGGILKKESDENEMKLRKEEAERAKLEEERAALGLDAPEDPEPESNSASNANLQDKETNSSSQEIKERGLRKKKEGDDMSTQQSSRKLPREPFNIKKSPYLVKSS